MAGLQPPQIGMRYKWPQRSISQRTGVGEEEESKVGSPPPLCIDFGRKKLNNAH